MSLAETRAYYLTELRKAQAEFQKRLDGLDREPIATEADYRHRAHFRAQVLNYYDPWLRYLRRRVVDTHLAEERDGVIFLYPVLSVEHYYHSLAEALRAAAAAFPTD